MLCTTNPHDRIILSPLSRRSGVPGGTFARFRFDTAAIGFDSIRSLRVDPSVIGIHHAVRRFAFTRHRALVRSGPGPHRSRILSSGGKSFRVRFRSRGDSPRRRSRPPARGGRIYNTKT